MNAFNSSLFFLLSFLRVPLKGVLKRILCVRRGESVSGLMSVQP